MYTIKKISITLFILCSSIAFNPTTFATHNSYNENAHSDFDYNDFDSLADDMAEKGIEQEKPKPLNHWQRLMNSICSPIIMKYVLLKAYVRDWSYWIIGLKKN